MAGMDMRMTPAEAIPGIPLHAVKALGKEKAIGSLDPGKQDDRVLLDSFDYRHRSYHFGVKNVWKAVKKGRVL
jgi:imidazolonepropionase-like amidohydrolase